MKYMNITAKDLKGFLAESGDDFNVKVYYNRYGVKTTIPNYNSIKNKYVYEYFQEVRDYVSRKVDVSIFDTEVAFYEGLSKKVEEYLLKEKSRDGIAYKSFIEKLFKAADKSIGLENTTIEVQGIGNTILVKSSVSEYFKQQFLDKYLTLRSGLNKE